MMASLVLPDMNVSRQVSILRPARPSADVRARHMLILNEGLASLGWMSLCRECQRRAVEENARSRKLAIERRDKGPPRETCRRCWLGPG